MDQLVHILVTILLPCYSQPMAKKRFDNLDPEKQTRLFDSAAEEFSAHGYDGASLNRILKKSGMSKSSLYYYFEDKADLFVSLTERSLAFLMREIGGFDPDSLTAESFWPEIKARIEQGARMLDRNTWYVKLGRMFYRLRGQRRGPEKTGRVFEVARNFVARTLARGQALGVVRTDLPQSFLIEIAMGLGEAVDQWMITHWDDMSPEERQSLIDVNFQLFYQVLGPQQG